MWYLTSPRVGIYQLPTINHCHLYDMKHSIHIYDFGIYDTTLPLLLYTSKKYNAVLVHTVFRSTSTAVVRVLCTSKYHIPYVQHNTTQAVKSVQQ